MQPIAELGGGVTQVCYWALLKSARNTSNFHFGCNSPIFISKRTESRGGQGREKSFTFRG